MISVIDIILLAAFGFAGYRMWSGTTSPTARAVSIACVVYLGWVLVVP